MGKNQYCFQSLDYFHAPQTFLECIVIEVVDKKSLVYSWNMISKIKPYKHWINNYKILGKKG